MPSGTGLSHFAKSPSGRYFDVGIGRKSTLRSSPAGLATQGFATVLAFTPTFFPARYDMAIHDIAIQN